MSRKFDELEKMAIEYAGANREDYTDEQWEKLEDAYWTVMLIKMDRGY